MSNQQDLMTSVVVTDCGSTTTKAICFARENGRWKVVSRAEAPTTVEKPVADVTIGVMNALRAIENELDIEIVDNKNLELASLNLPKPSGQEQVMPQAYLSTSSAGGGLQMVALGLVSKITAKSAERAALGAGAIVQKVYSFDSDLEIYEAADQIRELRPDIVILAGGTDGGAEKQVLELCELLLLSEPKSRFESDQKIPLVYAGNSNVKEKVQEMLQSVFSINAVENVRPQVEREDLAPARTAVHDIFLDHVMSQAPGYQKLQELVTSPLIPTPVAVSEMIEHAARNSNKSILAVDIGGATTDIFSIRRKLDNKTFRPVHRTVSANLGMSYSIGNVVELSGIELIKRWLPFDISDDDLQNTIWNKMIRPTSLPESMNDLLVEHAVAREALRLSLDHHVSLDEADREDGLQKDLGDIFRSSKQNVFSMLELDMLIGSGGVLSHAPSRASAFMMIVDSFLPKGVTKIGLDSIFMLPHLGVLSRTSVDIAIELLYSECIVPLGTYISPIGRGGKYKKNDLLYKVYTDDNVFLEEVRFGEIKLCKLDESSQLKIRIEPVKKDLVFSNTSEHNKYVVEGGKVGLVFDGRLGCFDILLKESRAETQNKWYRSIGVPQ